MTIELWILLSASLLGLIHLSAASFTFKAQVGNKYTVGARDENLQPTGIAGRLYRAQQNFLETFAIFAVCVLLVHITNAYGSLSYWGSILYLIGRVLFLPLYAWGVPWLRTLTWKLATLGLVLVGIQVVAGNMPQTTSISSIDIGGAVELSYVQHGSGEPVVLIHGSLADLGYWEPLATAFREGGDEGGLDFPNVTAEAMLSHFARFAQKSPTNVRSSRRRTVSQFTQHWRLWVQIGIKSCPCLVSYSQIFTMPRHH